MNVCLARVTKSLLSSPLLPPAPFTHSLGATTLDRGCCSVFRFAVSGLSLVQLRSLYVPKAVSITLCPAVLRAVAQSRRQCVRKQRSSTLPPMGGRRLRRCRRSTSPLITPFLMSMVWGHDSSSLSSDHRPTVCPHARPLSFSLSLCLLLSAERLEHATSVPFGRSALVATAVVATATATTTT